MCYANHTEEVTEMSKRAKRKLTGCEPDTEECTEDEEEEEVEDSARIKAFSIKDGERIPCEVVYVDKSNKVRGGIERYTKDKGSGKFIQND